jgi:hypothetical protein
MKARLAEPLRVAQTSASRPAPPSLVHVGRPDAAPTRRLPRRLAEQLRAARGAADALAAEAEAQERLARFDAHLSAGAPPGECPNPGRHGRFAGEHGQRALVQGRTL